MGTYGDIEAAYEALYAAGKWRGLGNRKGGAPGTFDGPALVALCRRAEAVSPDEYRRCMYRRRAWLHGRGRHGEVYDGTDASAWDRARTAGKVGVNPFVERAD